MCFFSLFYICQHESLYHICIFFFLKKIKKVLHALINKTLHKLHINTNGTYQHVVENQHVRHVIISYCFSAVDDGIILIYILYF
jgi:hypothetical protein